MKRILAIILSIIMVLSLAACGTASTNSDGEPQGAKAMSMGTGSPTGTYYAYGGVIGQYIKNYADISVNAVSTGGSKDNIQGIDVKDYALGTVQSDVMHYAWNGTRAFETDGKINTFRTVAGLYAEAVQLVTTNPNVKTVADLKGKKVSIGAPGSGVYFNAIDILGAAGLTEKDINPQYQNFDQSADALKDGKIDAAFIVAGAPTPAITELCMTNAKTRIVPIDGAIADKLMKDNTFYSVYKIPAKSYNNQDTEVTTVTVKATLIVSADATEDDVYKITKAIFDNTSDITKEHAKGAELSLQNATEGLTVPFHAGAAKYFKEKGIEVATK
ncbi:MAG: TAXI family TRAP transporter solute-binding subunit [Clostridia bacterium]|nr:TAXI family TRAP transporter solute-binding subunit [Clostridia bacterium]MBR4973217.1 TAXI family TRAP transporter solute-binding subunit [Clostridia bacterium]